MSLGLLFAIGIALLVPDRRNEILAITNLGPRAKFKWSNRCSNSLMHGVSDRCRIIPESQQGGCVVFEEVNLQPRHRWARLARHEPRPYSANRQSPFTAGPGS